MLPGILVALSIAFTIFELVQYHLCSAAAIGTETAQNCSPAGARGAVGVGLVLLVISFAVLVITVGVVRRRSLR